MGQVRHRYVRRVCSRFDQYARRSLAVVHFASTVIWLKETGQQNLTGGTLHQPGDATVGDWAEAQALVEAQGRVEALRDGLAGVTADRKPSLQTSHP